MKDDEKNIKVEQKSDDWVIGGIAGLSAAGAGFLTFQYKNGSLFLENLQKANEILKPIVKDWVDINNWDDYKQKLEHSKAWVNAGILNHEKEIIRGEQIDIFNVLKKVTPRGEEIVNSAKIALVTALVAGIAVYAVGTMIQPKEQHVPDNNIKELTLFPNKAVIEEKTMQAKK